MTNKEAAGVMFTGMLYTVLFSLLLFAIPFLPAYVALLLLLLLPAIPAMQAIKLRFSTAVCFAILGISTISMLSEEMMMIAIWLYCTGLGLGWGFKKQLRLAAINAENQQHFPLTADQVLVPGFSGAMIGTLMLMMLIPGLTGTSIQVGLDNALDTMTVQMWELPGIEPDMLARIVANVESSRVIIQDNLVFMLCSISFFVTLLSYYLSRFLLHRLGTNLPNLPGFSYWELPSRLIMVLLVTFIPSLMAESSGIWPLVFINSLNQLILLLCALLGLSVIDFFLMQWRWPSWLRCLLRPVIYITPTMSTILILIGMLDISFDMRKLRRMVV